MVRISQIDNWATQRIAVGIVTCNSVAVTSASSHSVTLKRQSLSDDESSGTPYRQGFRVPFPSWGLGGKPPRIHSKAASA